MADIDLEMLNEADREFFQEFAAWLAEHLPPFKAKWPDGDLSKDYQMARLRAWQSEMSQGGWIAVTWPPEYGGRGANGVQKILMDMELSRLRAPQALWAQGVENVGAAIIAYGTDEQKTEFLPKLRLGDWVWCQGFSEPDAGSDLASLKTKATKVEGGYRFNGQKIWTTNALFADHMWLLARTDPDAPKHRGLSIFILDMQQPGVTVQPLREISGEKLGKQVFGQQFNQVFFDDAFVPEFNRIGAENDGWRVAKAVLTHERSARGNLGFAAKTLEALLKFRDAEEPKISDQLDDAFALQLEEMEIKAAGLEYMYESTLEAMLAHRGSIGGESSVIKLLSSELRQQAAELALSVAGLHGIIARGSPEAFKGGNAGFEYLRSRTATIGGGTSEIQRNWIAERVLGFPKS